MLLDTYHKTVGRGAQLVLGLAPDSRGLLPESGVARLKEFGDAIRRRYAKPLTPSTPMERADTTIHACFSPPASFDKAVLMESPSAGQRVRSYEIQAWADKQWSTVSSGTTIGHKKIDIFSRTTSARVRLVLEGDQPRIREFHLF